MKVALLQLNSSDDPAENLVSTCDVFDQAVSAGADFVLTPEVTNCVSASRSRQQAVLCRQADDPTLVALRKRAADAKVWLLIGSLALRTGDPDGRFSNRSFLIGSDGSILATYDKIHMFDVTVSKTESYRESAGYRPGDHATIASTPFGCIGMTICYDIRFPRLYRHLARAGAEILTVPSAFSPVTGAAHWEMLLRARAIETGSFILAPAQTGDHASSTSKSRSTYGHSMVVGPWGDVLADAGDVPGMIVVDLNLSEVSKARSRIPSLRQDNYFDGP